MGMTTHVAASSGPIPVPRPRIRRPGSRSVAWLVGLAIAVVVAAAPQQVQAAAHATCTLGTPPGTTCGEALVLLGYP